jgi:nitrate/nitrite transport system ATP-binding protein
MPWLTVYENVELAVQQVFRKRMSKRERKEWILHNLALVHMDHALDKRPGEISGGMAQRVGIARALAMKPSVLLMDEPFGALDALTRAHLQDSLMEIQQELNNTVIMITHDVDEAVLLSDRIIMMTNGPAATVGEDLAIELPRPRDRVTLADDPAYVRYRQAVLSFLYEKQRFTGKEPASKKDDDQEQRTGETRRGLRAIA